MSGKFTHALCAACFAELEPERVPVRVKDSPKEPCCRCGASTDAGIYYRAPPMLFPCAGAGGTHAEIEDKAPILGPCIFAACPNPPVEPDRRKVGGGVCAEHQKRLEEVRRKGHAE